MKNITFILLFIISILCFNIENIFPGYDNLGIFTGITIGCYLLFRFANKRFQKVTAFTGMIVMLLISLQELLDLTFNYKQLFFDTAKYDVVFWLQLGTILIIAPLISLKDA